MKSFKKGFTLIELLVVVAIIGILALVVTASLGSARTKAQDAKIKAEISSLRAEAELIALENSNSYATVCDTGSMADTVSDNCYDSAGAWAADKALSGGNFFCVDSTGTVSEGTSTSSIGASDFVC